MWTLFIAVERLGTRPRRQKMRHYLVRSQSERSESFSIKRNSTDAVRRKAGHFLSAFSKWNKNTNEKLRSNYNRALEHCTIRSLIRGRTRFLWRKHNDLRLHAAARQTLPNSFAFSVFHSTRTHPTTKQANHYPQKTSDLSAEKHAGATHICWSANKCNPRINIKFLCRARTTRISLKTCE